MRRPAPCAMFFTRLNSTRQRLKSAERAQRLAAPRRRGGPAAASRRPRRGRHRARRSPGRTRAARARSARARASNADDCGARRRRRRRGGTPLRGPLGELPDADLADRCPSARADPSGSGRCRASGAAARTDRASRSPVSPAIVQPDDRVELVGQRHRRPGHRGRRRAAPCDGAASASTADRQVVVVDRLPHRLGLPFSRARRCRPSCPAARGTRTPCRSRDRPSPAAPPSRRAPRLSGRSEHVAGNPARQRLDPLGLVAIAPELLVEDHVCRRSSRDLQRDLAGPRPRRTCASRSRAVTTRSAFLAMTRSSPGCVLTTARNASFSSPSIVDHRKVVLVVDQRGRQHLLRQLEERRGKKPATTPGNSTRSATSSTSAGMILAAARGRPAAARGDSRSRAMRSRRSACVEHHEMLGQPRLVLVEAAHLDRPARAAAGGQEAMAVGHARRTRRPAPAARRHSRRGRS